MQNVKVQFQKYQTIHRDTLVLFHFLSVRSAHSENNRSTCLRGSRRHEIQLRQSLVAGLAIQPKLYGTLCLKWSSVLELCHVTLQFRDIINQLVHIYITYLLKLPTQRDLQCVELQRQGNQTDMNISYRRLLKPKKWHKTTEFRLEVFVLVFVNREKKHWTTHNSTQVQRDSDSLFGSFIVSDNEHEVTVFEQFQKHLHGNIICARTRLNRAQHLRLRLYLYCNRHFLSNHAKPTADK